MTMMLPTTLAMGVAALLINFWLGMRCAQVRSSEKINVGDGGNEMLLRRMRAQSNFIEQVPLILIVLGVLEAAGKCPQWLTILAGLFMLGRIAHAFGMDGNFKAGRPIGMITGMILQLGMLALAIGALTGKM